MSGDDALYQQVILDHSRTPRHYGQLVDGTHGAEGDNPLCGDHYEIHLKVDAAGRIHDVAFEGAGCAISKASASLMSEAILGCSGDEVEQLFESFHALVMGRRLEEVGDLGKLKAFSGVWKYPSRVKCAILCWHTVRSALASGTTVSTEERIDAIG